MQENTGTFQPLGDSDRRLPGATALLACGLTLDEQSRLHAALLAAGLEHLPLIGVAEGDADATLENLSVRAAGLAPFGEPALPRAVILSGLRERDLHGVMAAYRAAALPQALWASVTPVNATWPMRVLLTELVKERAALRDAMAAQRAARDQA